jgi:two-component system, sensor histidine kinase and response regulator
MPATNHISPPGRETLPAGVSAEMAGDPVPIAGRASILLVDDRPDKRLAMETIIADLGENIVQASSGKEALRCLLQQEFAVILLDVNMPGMDGFETALLIRQRERTAHTPIIFVTGISDTETHVSRGYSLGAVDYILTPVMPEVLRTKVQVFVELFKKTDQVKRQAERLQLARDELEARVRLRTSELAIANQALQEEIAERQRAEAETRQLNIELEHRVLDRTSELATANQELEAFTYSVAHDLEAPLRHVQSYAEMLEKEYAAQIPAEARQYLKRIELRARNMGKMLEDLLKLSLIGKQSLDCQSVRLNRIVEEIRAGLEIGDRQIEWRVEDLPRVACDPGLIKQVFVNLISNAVKYTRLKEKAVVEIGQMPVNDGVAIYVRDNGVGFDMKYADKLFGVFQRLHGAEAFEGSGVGLAIAARIVRKHGGRIWAESEIGKGAMFCFTLDGRAKTIS